MWRIPCGESAFFFLLSALQQHHPVLRNTVQGDRKGRRKQRAPRLWPFLKRIVCHTLLSGGKKTQTALYLMCCAAPTGPDLTDISHQICQTRHAGLF